ncbi:MAG: hypothetical protein AB4290_10590 [Spirulina sp.]
MVKTIKLMADYGCYALWWHTPNKAGDIDPETLPLKLETIQRLENWADCYDEILNEDDPAASDFPSPEAAELFEKEGISLWLQLRQELSPDYEVGYFSETFRQYFHHPQELEKFETKFTAIA